MKYNMALDFLRSRKGRFQRISAEKYLILLLLALALESSLKNSFGIVQLVVSPAVAVASDFAIKYLRYKRKEFPEHGLITGLIIALVLSPLNIIASISVPLLAIILKNIIRYKGKSIFNPAALALFASGFVMAPAAWWGTESVFVIPLGLLVAYRIRRHYNSLSFVALTLLISSAYSFAKSGTLLVPLSAVMFFFAFVMLLEPVTSPYTKKGQVVFGLAVATASFFLSFTQADVFLASLLIVNMFTPLLNRMK